VLTRIGAAIAEPGEGERTMALQLYEIVVRGSAGPGVHNAFRNFDITVDDDCTRLRTELMDQAALFSALDRVHALGLEVLEVRRITQTTSSSPWG
jgi:hypothetical protein